MSVSYLIVRATAVVAMIAMVHVVAVPISQDVVAEGWVTVHQPVLVDVS